MDRDSQVRLAAFRWLAGRTDPDHPGLITSRDAKVFRYQDQAIHLWGQPGIWKPRQMDLPLSLRTAPPERGRPAPYDDAEGPDGTIRYRYRGTDPAHRDNAGVRRLILERRPVIYLFGLEKGVYMAFWPTFIVRDDPATLTFTLQADAAALALPLDAAAGEGSDARRQYITVAARRRLHQAAFRLRILRAYRRRCSVCRLGHERLLDAAHIIPDREERGVPVTSNGLSLCKIHHGAYDGNILGIDPDHRIHIREDILEEVDGPMLRHGLQDLHGARLLVTPRHPTDRPNPAFLEERYAGFRQAK